MFSIHNIIASVNNLVFLMLLITLLSNFIIANRQLQVIFILFVGILMLLLPCYHGFSVVQIIKAIVGDLSISGMLVTLFLGASYFINGSSRQLLHPSVSLIVVMTGLILYLSNFAMIDFDFYTLGYHPNTLMLIVVLLIELAVWRSQKIIAIIWLVALLSFYFKLQHSTNLWDYLLDPIFWLICIYNLLFTRSRI